ncbi:MAG: hypothetical protein ACRDJL_02475 [Actinomycetota bacterium]
MLFGLGLPEWLTIIGLLGGLILTFYVMARASVAYEAKRKARENGSREPTDPQEQQQPREGAERED